LKILHAIPSLSPADGGPPQVVLDMALASRAIGVEVEVLCLDRPESDFLSGYPVPVRALGSDKVRSSFTSELPQWFRAHAGEYDGIVVHSIWNYLGISVRKVAREQHFPYVIFPHGALDPWFNRKYPLKKLKKQLFWFWQYPVLRDAKAVLFTCDTERDLAATSFRPSTWNGVSVSFGTLEPEGEPGAQRTAFYQRLPALLQDGRPRRYLLFLARIHEKKGCDLLLEAFARIASSAPDLHLVIAGPDQVGLQAKLQQQAAQAGIADRVHWPGMLRGDVKWGALRHCEAFVLPSHQENFGIAVAEALACGKPVLISDQVNIWPDIETDQSGLVEKDTLEGTRRLLERWLALNPSQREAMASRALPCFRKRYSMQETARAIRDLFSTS
jgi:glycosyltransferase involved in cell wall biosynthesis